MKKSVLIFMICWFISLSLSFAETVDENRATQIARNWYQYSTPSQKRVRSTEIKSVQKQDPKDVLYIVNMVSGGFVIVSANDIVSPVLAYSFESEMNMETLNPAAKSFLNYYSAQIADAIALGITTAQTRDEWQSIETNDFSTQQSIPAMPPLISTKWRQSDFYNTFTPVNCPTGCVATAMAQIMKYHNYPETGLGQHSYFHDTYGHISADFTSQYQWTQMPDILLSSSLPEEISAVAKLMYHCGISLDMNYGPDVSNATTSKTVNSLKQYFGYSSTAIYKRKQYYSDQEWTAMVIEELNQRRPLIYRGNNLADNNGHAFICDGYQGTDFFHMNWGWGGTDNGYFRLSLLDTGEHDFTYDQAAVFGIQPENEVPREAIFQESFETSFPATGWTQHIVYSGTLSPEWSAISNDSMLTCTAYDGSHMLKFNAQTASDGAEARLVLPAIDLSDVNYPALNFQMFHDMSFPEKANEGIIIQISENGTDWTDLQFYPRYTFSSGWHAYRIDLSYYTGKMIYVAFLGHSQNGSNIYLDQIALDVAGAIVSFSSQTQISYAGESILFTDHSLNAKNYYWDFGDQTSSLSKNTRHIFENPGVYTITHSINDHQYSETICIHILPVISSSYLPEDGGDFESNTFHFFSQAIEGDINLWEHGTPHHVISNTASGDYVWKTDLDGNIQKGDYACALYTPGFRLAETGTYWLKFKYRMYVDNLYCPGIAWMDYSIDHGKTWQRLGGYSGNPDGTNNWYNTSSNQVASDGIGWWKNQDDYLQAVYNITTLHSYSYVAFRFVFKISQAWLGDVYGIDGFSIDDFSIEKTAPEARMTINQSVSYIGKELIFSDQSVFFDDYLWDFGDGSTSSSKNAVHTYTSPGQYTVTLSVNNQSLSASQQLVILPQISPPYHLEDGGNFEINPFHFSSQAIENDINLWERGNPMTTKYIVPASGQNVWITDLKNKIQKGTYSCALYTPEFDLSKDAKYYISFKYRMNVINTSMPGAAWLEYSTDHGNTWQRLGSYDNNPDETQNWYNSQSNKVAPDGICWWASQYKYIQAKYNLSEFAGTPHMSFRFVYRVLEGAYWADLYFNLDGFVVDDFELISDCINEHQYPTDTGWHLISLPVLPDNRSLTHLFPDARVAFEYSNNQYVRKDQLEPGIGYWVLLAEQAHNITGHSMIETCVNYNQGWQMVGSMGKQASRSMIEDYVEAIYLFENGGYSSVSQIMPGRGYWIKFNQDCRICW